MRSPYPLVGGPNTTRGRSPRSAPSALAARNRRRRRSAVLQQGRLQHDDLRAAVVDSMMVLAGLLDEPLPGADRRGLPRLHLADHARALVGEALHHRDRAGLDAVAEDSALDVGDLGAVVEVRG